MNGKKSNKQKSRHEYEKGSEGVSRGLARKLGGLANRLMGSAEAVITEAQDIITNVSSKVNRRGERERIVKDCGYYDIEKYSLFGREGERMTEDASYINEQEGIFGIFDGAGGVGKPGSGRIASRTARDSFKNQVENKKISSYSDLIDFLNKASRDVGRKTEGITTATVAKIVEEKGRKYLYYAQAGDSRLYVVHKGDKTHKGWAEQITRDEGKRNLIANWLGRDDRPVELDKNGQMNVYIREKVTQAGRIPISNGDRIVICSDGVTGDINRQMEDGRNELMGINEVARIVNRAEYAQTAARALVEQARKKDDRSAIVVEV